MKEKVAAPVDTLPDSADVSAAVCRSRAAPNWIASPPAVPCRVTCRVCVERACATIAC